MPVRSALIEQSSLLRSGKPWKSMPYHPEASASSLAVHHACLPAYLAFGSTEAIPHQVNAQEPASISIYMQDCGPVPSMLAYLQRCVKLHFNTVCNALCWMQACA